MKKESSCFKHEKCEFFPCHKGIKKDDFNCLFCFCPLYALGENCGGNITYTEDGKKDCSNCLLPHKPENYDFIISKLDEVVDSVKKRK